MKRLIRKASTKTLYHGTNYDGLLGITNLQAIYPNEGNGAGKAYGREDKHDGYSFLATTIDKAFSYAKETVYKQKAGDLIAIIEASLSEDALQPDDVDCPECKTWQESDQRVKQVKVNGTITSEYIKTVYLYDPNNFNLICESTLKSWQKDYEENKNSVGQDGEASSDVLDFLTEQGINAQTISFANNANCVYAYNDSLSEYSTAITKFDSSISKLYGEINEDECLISHYKEILDINHNGTTFEYDIPTSTVTFYNDIDFEVTDSIIKNVFQNTNIICQNKTYTLQQFIQYLQNEGLL